MNITYENFIKNLESIEIIKCTRELEKSFEIFDKASNKASKEAVECVKIIEDGGEIDDR